MIDTRLLFIRVLVRRCTLTCFVRVGFGSVAVALSIRLLPYWTPGVGYSGSLLRHVQGIIAGAPRAWTA